MNEQILAPSSINSLGSELSMSEITNRKSKAFPNKHNFILNLDFGDKRIPTSTKPKKYEFHDVSSILDH